MTKLYLSEKAFRALVQVSSEMKIPQSELVSELILQYAKTPIEQRDSPSHLCAFCSLAFFSEDALTHHLQRHKDKMVVKNEASK